MNISALLGVLWFQDYDFYSRPEPPIYIWALQSLSMSRSFCFLWKPDKTVSFCSFNWGWKSSTVNKDSLLSGCSSPSDFPPRKLLRSTLPGNLGKSTKLAFWAGRGKTEQNLQWLNFCWSLRPNWQFRAQSCNVCSQMPLTDSLRKNHAFWLFCVTAKELLSKTFIITQRGGNFSCYLSNFMTKWYYFWWNWIKRIYNCLQSSWSMKLNFGWNFATLLTWRPPDQTWTWHLLHRNVNISKHALSKHHKNSQIVEFSLCQNLW